MKGRKDMKCREKMKGRKLIDLQRNKEIYIHATLKDNSNATIYFLNY